MLQSKSLIFGLALCAALSNASKETENKDKLKGEVEERGGRAFNKGGSSYMYPNVLHLSNHLTQTEPQLINNLQGKSDQLSGRVLNNAFSGSMGSPCDQLIDTAIREIPRIITAKERIVDNLEDLFAIDGQTGLDINVIQNSLQGIIDSINGVASDVTGITVPTGTDMMMEGGARRN